MTSGGAAPRLGDRYVLGRVLGRGATGAVYAAHDGNLDRPVAVKLLVEAGDTLTTPERFQREARTTARLNHPNIVAVHDVGRVSERDTVDAPPGTPFLVMELLTGGSWRDEIFDRRPSPQRVAKAMAGVARALAAAHAVGVTHRDIKPANVLITGDGEAKLADFGIAKSSESTGLTTPGDFVGTLAYTAPECLEGQAATSAADVWSFGVMLYESLAGHRPFEQETIGALITAIQSGRYRSLAYDLPTLAHSLSAAVDRCLDPDPPHRPTAAELAAVLTAVASTADPTATRQVSGPPELPTGPAWDAPVSAPPRPVSGPGASRPVSGSGWPVPGPPVAGPPGSDRPVSGPPPSGPPASAPPVPGQPVSGPPVSGPPVSGPPVSGPPVSGPPVSGPPVSGPPVSGAPVAGRPVSGHPVAGEAGGWSLSGTGTPGWAPSGGRAQQPPRPPRSTPPGSAGFASTPPWPTPTHSYGPPPQGPPPPLGTPANYPPPSPNESKKKRRWLIPLVLLVVFGLVLAGGFGARGLLGRAGGCSGSLPLVVATSPEKAGVMATLADRYDSSPGSVNGTCIHVQLMTVKSGDAVTALSKHWPSADYGPRPDVWSPASSVWVGLVGQRTGAIGTVPNAPSLARTPLVIAAPESVAKALGWPAKSPSWSEIAQYAGDQQAWDAVSHTSGPFMFARTNPLVSTSGLHATLAAYLAAPGHTGNVAADLRQNDVKLFLRTLERSTDRYGDTTLTFLDALRQAEESGQQATSSVSALAVEEQTVWAYNQGEPISGGDSQQPAPKEKLVAMHPSDGTLVSDHPYVLVNSVIDAPWVTPAKQQAAKAYLNYLLADKQQAEFRKHGFRDADDKLDPAVVKSAGNLVTAEPANTFSPPQPAAVQTLLDAWKNLNRQANVLIVLDTSGSMKDVVPGAHASRLQLATEAAQASLSYFGTNDRVGLWEFSTNLDGTSDHREIVPISPKNEAALSAGLKNLTPKNDTGLYDTARDAVAKVRSHASKDAINAVVLLTDGDNKDPKSISVSTMLAGLGNSAGQPAVRVYPVAFGGDLTPSGQQVLKQMAKASGGEYYSSIDPRQIDSVLGDVMSNF